MKDLKLFSNRFKFSVSKLNEKLGGRGVEIITRIAEDSDFCKRIADNMLTEMSGLNEKGLSLRLAKAIIGDDGIIGPTKIQQFFQEKIHIDENDLLDSEHVPYLPETLAKHKDSHLLVFGLSIPLKLVSSVSPIGFEQKTPSVVMESVPKQGWFLINRFVNPFSATEKVRLATVAEAYYTFSIYRNVTRNNMYFLHNEHALCKLHENDDEVYLGLGLSSKTNDYEYLIRNINPQNFTEKKISIILPDDPSV